MEKEISILDYGAGNIASLKSAFLHVGASVNIACSKEDIERCSTLVIPGVGSFDSAIRQLNNRGLKDAVIEAVHIRKKKTLGICLGMQLFFTESEEGSDPERGLAIFDAKVKGLKSNKNISIPHIGFNRVFIKEKLSKADGSASKLLSGIEECYFYFVHSYMVPLQNNLTGLQLITEYGEEFLSGYEDENIFLTQFHPEKSQTNGLQLLANFLQI